MNAHFDPLGHFEHLVAIHHGVMKQASNQYDFIKRANSQTFSFFKPKLDPEGVCDAAVTEWYKYRQAGLNLLNKFNAQFIDETLVEELNALHMHHKEIFKKIMTDLKTQAQVDKLSVAWVEDAFLSKLDAEELEKVYNLTCESHARQLNWKTISRYRKSIKQQQTVMLQPVELKTSKDANNFEKILATDIPEHFTNHLLLINLQYGKSNAMKGHATGLTNYQRNNKDFYLFYDPNFGEAEFTSVVHLKQFLKDLFSFYYVDLLHLSSDYYKISDVVSYRSGTKK